MELPPRELILSPWLPEKGLAMIFAERGIGKTWIALNLAYCMASAGSFLRWYATQTRRVLYIDGEMPGRVLKDRLELIIESTPFTIDGDNIKFIAADFQPNGLPDLVSEEGQKFYDEHITWADVVIVDNLSTVCRGLKENEADSFSLLVECPGSLGHVAADVAAREAPALLRLYDAEAECLAARIDRA